MCLKLLNKFTLSFFICCFVINILQAQNYTLSGYIKDFSNGETLIGANVYNTSNPMEGTTSNIYGFYSLTLPKGKYTISFSYLGFQEKQLKLDLSSDLKRDIELSAGIMIDEVLVLGEEKDKNVQSTEMGVVELPIEKIKKLPALLGEVDILKTLQLLPGVLSAGEGTAGFYVRGGGPDQNLVLLDEAVVYNSGHMLGFFSVFNADVIKNTSLIKGGIPAYYGGRLSSVVDVQMKDGNGKKYEVKGGIGLISSRLTIEGPIQKKQSSFIVSARRTYAFDLAQPFLNKTDFAGTNYYFYDINAKMNFSISDKDRLFLSGYFGRDVLDFQSNLRDFFFKMPYGNNTATLRWNHLFTDKLFMNASLIYNEYEFEFGGGQADFLVDLYSGVRDYNVKLDFDYYPNSQNEIKYGVNYTYHKMTPNIATATNGDIEFTNDFEPKFGHEAAVFIQNDQKINKRLSLNYGLRASMFQQVGPYTSSISTTEFKAFEKVKTYSGIEPRLFAKYSLDKTSSLKGGITFTNQYIHLVSNSSSTLPIDVWVPSSEKVKPQQGVQYAIGLFKNFKNDDYETSIEVYYKNLKNQIDYRENYIGNPAVEVEDEFVFGKGTSYGAEFFLKKNYGKLSGWIGYTISKTDRIFKDINEGKSFPATYDRRHDLSVVANYEINNKLEAGAVFVYGTGNTYTPIRSLYFIEQSLNVEYGQRNSARLSPYHRIDFSLTYTPKENTEKRFKSSWTASVYNAYNRRNTFFTYTTLTTDLNAGTAQAEAFKVSIFPIIPSLTWNFKWQQ